MIDSQNNHRKEFEFFCSSINKKHLYICLLICFACILFLTLRGFHLQKNVPFHMINDHFVKLHHQMQEKRNDFFWSKKRNTTLSQAKTGKRVLHYNIYLPIFAWWTIVLRFFDPKQLLRVSCIWWCYFIKRSSLILQNTSLWCLGVSLLYIIT